MILPEDPKERKLISIDSGFIEYFPHAIVEITKQSMKGHLQHYDKDEPLHWDKSRSSDDRDAMQRHRIDLKSCELDGDLYGQLEASAAMAWRAIAICEKIALRVKAMESGNES